MRWPIKVFYFNLIDSLNTSYPVYAKANAAMTRRSCARLVTVASTICCECPTILQSPIPI